VKSNKNEYQKQPARGVTYLYKSKKDMIKIAIILADNVESSIRIISEDIVSNLPDFYSVDIFSIKYNSSKTTDNIKPLSKYFWRLRRYDIIHLQAAMPISLAMIIRKLHPRAYLLSTEHDFGWKYFRNTLPFIKSSILRLLLYIGRSVCHKNSYPSHSLFHDVTGKQDLGSRYAVVYNGIQDYFSTLEITEVKAKGILLKKIVVAGNYYYSKGIDLILSVVEEFSDIEFHLFGNVLNGLSEKKRKELQYKIARDNVYIYGKVERKVFLDFLKHEECVVCIPSRSEACPLVALEAMSLKHPIVVSDIPVFYELTNKSFAVMFDLENIESLKLSLRQAFAKYEILASNARKMYLDHYTIDKMSMGYDMLYRSLFR